MIAFLYLIQIFTTQEQIQAAITKAGLSMARTAYIYEDFLGAEEASDFDESIFGGDYDVGLKDLAGAVLNSSLLKLSVIDYLDKDTINGSCIKNGIGGLSLYYSKVMDEGDYIDVIVSYRMKLPIDFFTIGDMRMIQRVRVRGWTGLAIPAAYQIEEEGEDTPKDMVYITTSGSVYHINRDCSHIKLSIISVIGIPSERRNSGGAKYYPCEACCTGNENPLGTFYITSDGTRYHTKRVCSKIKRTVEEVPLAAVSDRTPCKRCGHDVN
jgi:hypothetical protein